MKNLMMISYDLPPNSIWGVALHVDQLLKNLNGRYSLEVISRFCNAANPFVTITSDVLTNDLIHSVWSPLESYVDYEHLMGWNYLLARKVIRNAGNRPDLIHNHNWMTFPAARMIADHFSTPLLSSMHFLQKQYYQLAGYAPCVDTADILEIENRILQESDRIILFGPNHRQFVLDHYECLPEKIEVIPHGIPAAPQINTSRAHDFFNLVFAGRLVPEKGILDLLEVVSRLKKKYPQLVLHVAGKGPLLSEVRKYGHCVQYHGFLNREALFSLFRQSDAFCFPSYTETFGLASLEAASMGLPIITSRGASVEKLYEPGQALFVDVTVDKGVYTLDRDQLYSQLDQVISNDKLRMQYSRRALDVASRYHESHMMAKLERLYHSLITSSAVSPEFAQSQFTSISPQHA